MKAFVVEKIGDKFTSSIKDVLKPKIIENELLIKVEYSSLNYKDALSSIGHAGVSRNFPHITGIDLAGTIEESKSPFFKKGEKVVVTGYDLGMNTDGGHSEFCKVPASWAIKIPSSLNSKEIMTYGTAGLTAALSINELLKNGLEEHSKVLVSGSTGGVGSLCVGILNRLNMNVTAITTKIEKKEFLHSIGASEVISLEEFMQNSNKGILKEEFDAFIDSVGGDILAQGLKKLKYDGVATCCGLTASADLNTNVYPFILRGVRLIGIDSVECKLEKKEAAWQKLGSSFKLDCLNEIANEIKLEDIQNVYKELLDGKAVGRYVVKIS